MKNLQFNRIKLLQNLAFTEIIELLVAHQTCAGGEATDAS